MTNAIVICVCYPLFVPTFQVLILSCIETHLLVLVDSSTQELLRQFWVMDDTFPHWLFMTTFHPGPSVWCNISFGGHQLCWQSSWEEHTSRWPSFVYSQRTHNFSWWMCIFASSLVEMNLCTLSRCLSTLHHRLIKPKPMCL